MNDNKTSHKNTLANTIIHNNFIKHKIIKEIIEPFYLEDIKNNINNEKKYKSLGTSFELTSKIMITISSILSLSSGFFNYPLLSFMAGSTSTISLACIQFASYFYKKSNSNIIELNSLLQKIHIDTIPVEATNVTIKENQQDVVV